MNVGEKVRTLRQSKMMTQSELAGTYMTRNMLSYVENGSAMPSLSTISYLAERLNVPAGYFLSEPQDEIIYRKLIHMENIRKAYQEEEWWACRSLCQTAFPEPDDEICFLLARSSAGIAEDALEHGKLRKCCQTYDEALSWAAKTVYETPQIEAEAAVSFRYMRRISPTLYSEILDADAQPTVTLCTPFASYVEALDALDEGDLLPAELFRRRYGKSGFFAAHLAARGQIANREFHAAKQALESLLSSEETLTETRLYSLLMDLEVCCRETEDFKGAYRYANDRVQLHEQLLRD